MSWAEVKKINSDLSTPLNELIEYEQPPYNYTILANNGSGSNGTELSVTGPALVYAITGYGAGIVNVSIGFTITIDDLEYGFNFTSTRSSSPPPTLMGFCVSNLASSTGGSSANICSIPLSDNSTLTDRTFSYAGLATYARRFMPIAGTTLTASNSTNAAQATAQILDKPIKVNSLAKIRYNKGSDGANTCRMLILYKPLS